MSQCYRVCRLMRSSLPVGQPMGATLTLQLQPRDHFLSAACALSHAAQLRLLVLFCHHDDRQPRLDEAAAGHAAHPGGYVWFYIYINIYSFIYI